MCRIHRFGIVCGIILNNLPEMKVLRTHLHYALSMYAYDYGTVYVYRFGKCMVLFC